MDALLNFLKTDGKVIAVEVAQEFAKTFAKTLVCEVANRIHGADEPDQDTDLDLTQFVTDPIHFDTLVQQSKLTASELSARLLTLELEGKVKRYPGDMYVAT